jgi:hypothetical protein
MSSRHYPWYLAVMTLTGCSTCETWRLVAQEAPLCAQDRTATALIRSCHPPPFVVAGDWVEEAWSVGESVIHKEDIASEIDAYLRTVGFIDRQKLVDAFSDGIQQRVAEHRFFIVSISPTIVIMTPRGHGDLHQRSLRDMASPLNDRILTSDYLANGYHYGRSVPVAPTYQWFSPSVAGEIRPITVKNDRLVIEAGPVTLTFGERTTGNWYSVYRSAQHR